jgi:hypothetical protein
MLRSDRELRAEQQQLADAILPAQRVERGGFDQLSCLHCRLYRPHFASASLSTCGSPNMFDALGRIFAH